MKGTGPFGLSDPDLDKPVAVLRLPRAPDSQGSFAVICPPVTVKELSALVYVSKEPTFSLGPSSE